MKYVLVSGGVMSSLGKGLSASSVGLLLQQSGLRVTSIKIDPYLNTDAGTMSPFEHGECYVLDDSGECDLDLGNYERFLGITLTRQHNITTGKIFFSVLNAERRGDYLGKTVQMIPHITDECQRLIETAAQVPVDKSGKVPDVCVIELGGTVGDLESNIFLESLRQFKYRVGADSFCHIHVSLVPHAGEDNEQKSKPTQHAVKTLLQSGLPPDLIFCRSKFVLDKSVAKKISLFCMVPPTSVISVHDCPNVMHVPQLLLDQNVPGIILNNLRINRSPCDSIPAWSALTSRLDNLDPKKAVKIAIVGKYTTMQDAYLSVKKSLFYASLHCDRKVEIVWLEASHLEAATQITDNASFVSAWTKLKQCHGILIPGGFGNRGVEGMALAAHYARLRKIPFLGICLGFQVAVIEFARSELNIPTATSAEFDPSSQTPMIVHMSEISKDVLGGTMRLGSHSSLVSSGSLAHYLYGKRNVIERHRHRYEVNPEYIPQIHEAGGRFTGTDEKRQRMEIFELDSTKHPHPYFLGVQFHPEFLSRVMTPSPPFVGLVLAAAGLFSNQMLGENLHEQPRHSALPPFFDNAPFAFSPSSNAVDDKSGSDQADTNTASTSATPVPTPKLFIFEQSDDFLQ